jgi:enoyl-[acyl-carrier protein] reductase II
VRAAGLPRYTANKSQKACCTVHFMGQSQEYRKDHIVLNHPMLNTPVCDLLGIDVPIICAPFGPWDQVDLAAAVCEAGGLGSVGSVLRPAAELRLQWESLRARTTRPFAINHTARPFDPEVFAEILDFGPAVVSFHLGDPDGLVQRAHAVGALWMQQVMNVEQARRAVDLGVDVIIAQGAEAGGHGGRVSTMVLVPQVIDIAGTTPVVAAGGIADGRGLAAALALGAQAVNIGTRFLASSEFAGSDDWKKMILEAGAEDTVQTDALDPLMPPYTMAKPWNGNGRMLRGPFLAEWDGRTDELTDRAGELAPEMIDAILAGDGHEYVPFAGQSVGLIHDILPAAEIVRRTVAQAHDALTRARDTATTIGR